MEKKKYKVELEINILTSLNYYKDLFELNQEELRNKKLIITNNYKEYFITYYSTEKSEQVIEIIHKDKLQELLIGKKNIKIVLFIKYNEPKNNFSMMNTYKYKKIENLYNIENCERIWEILPKSGKNEILGGDIIKIGHLRLKFDQIYFGDDNKKELEQSILSIPNGDIEGELNKENYCRLCYQKENNKNDPLINPCKCKDSLKYIHLSCLKNDINLKIHKKHHKKYDFYLFQKYNCDICLSTYPKYLILKNQKINLIEIDKSTYQNYALCDVMQYDQKNDYVFHVGYIIIRLEKDSTIKIGRKKDNDIIFSDLSVSGNHCEIICEDKKLYIKDLGSTYGTLKYVQNEYEFQVNETIQLISDKYKFEFNLLQKEINFNFFGLGDLVKSIFDNKCCGYNAKDKGDCVVPYNKNNINSINEKDNNESKEGESSYEKKKYFEKFEDFDSYNDFIINMDNSDEIT